MSDMFNLIVGIVLAVVGGLIFAAAVSATRSCSQKTTARVVKVVCENTGYWRGTYPHYPVVTYTVNGKEYTVKSSTSTRFITKYKEGQEVVIRYNPKKPKEIQVGIGLLSYIVGAFIALCGVVLIAVYFM